MPAPSTIFPFRANTEAPIRERYGYRTDVMESEDGTEQRVQIRAKRVGGIAFDLLVTEREAAHANALLYGAITDPMGVPLWQYGSPTTAPLAAAETQVTIGNGIPATSPYVTGSYVIVWRSAFEYFVATVTGTSATSVQFTPAFSGATWAAGSALVMPLISARLSQQEVFSWDALRIGEASLAFDLEDEGAAKAWAGGGGSTYQSLNVLDVVKPNRDGAVADAYRRRFRVLDNLTGSRVSVANTAAPANVRPFSWVCASRADVGLLKSFLDLRKGRAVPFWLPTWQQDMTLAASTGVASGILIEDIGYTARMFPGTGARRHLMLHDGAAAYMKVTSAADLGTTETLGISPATPRNFDPSALASFLRYSRLAEDLTEIVWLNGEVAECELATLELPREAPV